MVLKLDAVFEELTGLAAPNKLIVITGGEPLRQNISPLVLKLLHYGYTVQIETNGTCYDAELDYTHSRLYISCSPKTPLINQYLSSELLEAHHSFKYLIGREPLEADGLPCAIARPDKNFEGRIYVQPLDEGDVDLNRLNEERAIGVAITHGHVFSSQLHKRLNIK